MAQYELNIRDYWRILRKRRFIMILTFFSTVIATVIYNSLQIPIYEATAIIRIEPRKTYITALTDQILGSTGDYMATEEKVIQSHPVIEEAAKRIGLIDANSTKDKIEGVIADISFNLSTQRDSYTNLLRIAVTSDNARQAQNIANAVAEVYLEENLKAKSKEAMQIRSFIEQQMNEREKKLKDIEEKVKKFREDNIVSGAAVSLENRLGSLRAELANMLTMATEKHPDVIRIQDQINEVEELMMQQPATELEYARLKRDAKVNEDLYIMLRSRYEEARIAEASTTSDARLINPAVEPQRPIRPNKKFAIALGMVVGAMMSVVLAFITEGLDTSIGTIEDVENLLKVPVLAIIPSVRAEEIDKIPFWKRGFLFKTIKHTSHEEDTRIALSVHLKPLSQVAEAYRLLRTNLKIANDRRVLTVTSCGPREGKTTVLINLAVTLAQMGTKTLVVDTDLRRPMIYKIFGVDKEPGLSEIITTSRRWQDTIKNLTDILMGSVGFDEALKNPGLDNLHILTSGHILSNPSELLSSNAMDVLISELKNHFEVILFDTPPALSITDAAILAPKTDGTLLAYEMGRTARNALLRGKMQLESVGAKVLGIILNHISPDTYIDTGYYPYYQSYKYKYYSEELTDEGKSKKDKKKL